MADARPGALARRRPRLADLPAAPLLALLPLVPAKGPRAYVHLRPAGDDRVIVEAGGGAVVGVIELRGTLARELALPRVGLALLARRHPQAERLAVDGALPDGPAGMLRLAALDAHSSATVLAPEAELQPGTVSDLLRDPPLLAGAERAALLNTALLSQAADTLRRLCPGAADVEMPQHDLLALLIRGRPDPDGDVVAAAVALARCISVEA